MEKKLYSIYDQSSEVYNTPMYFNREAEAIRTFTTLVMDNNSLVSKFPDDYTLYEIGHWNDQTAVYTPHPAPVIIIKASHIATSLKLNRPEEN